MPHKNHKYEAAASREATEVIENIWVPLLLTGAAITAGKLAYLAGKQKKRHMVERSKKRRGVPSGEREAKVTVGKDAK